MKIEPWAVVLASREHIQLPAITLRARNSVDRNPAMVARDALADTLRRAAALSSKERIAAVIAGPGERWRRSLSNELPNGNVFLQPHFIGTAYEVLLALLRLETRGPTTMPVVFLPSDHVVSSEEIMARSLTNMVDWINDQSRPVYLLGAVPEGPHNQLGYIVPWHDSIQMPTGVYEFVEKPDVREARRLINAGALWNTFIFGGTVESMLNLFRPGFDATISALHRLLPKNPRDPIDPAELRAVYDRLSNVDFSTEVLARQTDALNVLRLPRCGWWPLQSPKQGASAAFADRSGAVTDSGSRSTAT